MSTETTRIDGATAGTGVTNASRVAGSPAPRPRRSRSVMPSASRPGPVAWMVLIVVGGFFGLLPVYWLVMTSFTTTTAAFAPGFHPIPGRLTLDNLRGFFADPTLVRYLLNSVIVATLTAALSVLVALYSAYSFSKFKYRGRGSIMSVILVGQLLPQSVLLISIYLVMQRLNLLDTYWALILSFTTFTLPLCVFTLKGFFDAIPTELIEAAKVDGARQRVIIHRVLLPILAPGLVAAGLFAFVRAWNDFIFALTLTRGSMQTLPPGIVRTYIGEAGADWPGLMAASLVVSVPVIAVFIALQRFLVSGLASGAVKG